MKKDENYPIFSEVRRDQIPDDAVVRDQPVIRVYTADMMSIAAFVLAILSIIPCILVLSAPLSLAGIILALIALFKGTNKKGFAISGLVINLLAFACSVAFMIFSATVTQSMWLNAIDNIKAHWGM